MALEVIQGAGEFGGAVEVVGGQQRSLDDRVVDLDLIEPAGVDGEMDEDQRRPAAWRRLIDGAVTLDANNAGVTLAGNYIAGAGTASANLNGTTISGNQIGGALTCTTNVPAPTNGGVSNTVGGGRSGQTCATLTF